MNHHHRQAPPHLPHAPAYDPALPPNFLDDALLRPAAMAGAGPGPGSGPHGRADGVPVAVAVAVGEGAVARAVERGIDSISSSSSTTRRATPTQRGPAVPWLGRVREDMAMAAA